MIGSGGGTGMVGIRCQMNTTLEERAG